MKHLSRKRRRHRDRQFSRTGEAQWAQWVEECAKECKCHNGPCDGVLCGALCDEAPLPTPNEDDHYMDDDWDTWQPGIPTSPPTCPTT